MGVDALQTNRSPASFHPYIKSFWGFAAQTSAKISNCDDLNMDGRTALSWAAVKSDARAVGILLEFGASPNTISHRGHGPLSWAA